MKKRKICVITGSRADYGHLRVFLKEVQKDSELRLQLIATGSHLSKKYGLTYREIEKEGFKIDRKINILKFSDTDYGVCKAVGLGCGLFGGAYQELKPDLIVVLGDRYEILAACVAGYILKIPIVHIHGGETSQGAMDEAFRHSITKMATFHFVATQDYRKRVIQLGENPKRVFYFGAPGLDALCQRKLLDKNILSKELNFKFEGQIALVTYHPTTLGKGSLSKELDALLGFLESFEGKVIFTKANADPSGETVNNRIKKFCQKDISRFKLVSNLGQLKYWSCLKYVNYVIGNSSSGLIEAPSFKVPVINVGDRQKGRVKAVNIIDVKPTRESILKGLKEAKSKVFLRKIETCRNPYIRFRDGRASFRLKEKIKHIPINKELLMKTFKDLI